MSWKPQSTPAENAARELPKLVRKYFDAGRNAVKRSRSPRELHRFRTRTKQFRYALEMFRPVYPDALEDRLALLQQLQKLLGEISDAYSIRGLLKNDEEYKRSLNEEGKNSIAAFQEYWKTTFDAAGQFKAWKTALRSPSLEAQVQVETT